MNDPIIFKRLSSAEEAKDLVQLLQDNAINCEATVDKINVDVTFANNDHDTQYLIKIEPSDFEKATLLLENNTIGLDDIEKDHYIFEFTNKELLDIIVKPDEWNDTDYNLAKQLLNKRGEKIDANYINFLKQERIENLSKPEKRQNELIIGSYFLAIFGGVLSVVIGYYLYKMKKKLPNGNKVYVYQEADRMHGKVIMFLGIISTLSWFVVYMYYAI